MLGSWNLDLGTAARQYFMCSARGESSLWTLHSQYRGLAFLQRGTVTTERQANKETTSCPPTHTATVSIGKPTEKFARMYLSGFLLIGQNPRKTFSDPRQLLPFNTINEHSPQIVHPQQNGSGCKDSVSRI